MGSNFVVVYACLFLCHLEASTPLLNHPHLAYFKIFIDDAFGVWIRPLNTLTLLLDRYGEPLKYHIKISPSISPSQATILDIEFYKGPIFYHFGFLDSKCHQKELNAFNYIPWISWHPTHQKAAFILADLKRYIICESSREGYLSIQNRFYLRLRAKGYPPSFLLRIFLKSPFLLGNPFLNPRLVL